MSQISGFGSGGGGGTVITLTGNSGGAVGPSTGNINVIGSGIITVTGNPGTNTLTITASGEATTFNADSGSATPSGGAITLAGGTGMSTSASGSTVTFTLTTPVAIANGGTNATTMAVTDGTVYFDGTRLVTTATGTSGQVLTSAGAGVAPAYAALPASSLTFNEDSGSATSSAGAITFAGGTGISTSGTSHTVTITLTTPVSIANGGTNATSMANTNGVIYYDGTRLVSLANGTTGQVLNATTSSAPSWGSAAASLLPWTDVTSGTQAAAINNGYIADKSTLTTVTLPSTAAVGSVVAVAGLGTGGWKLAQNASQVVNFGSSPTTSGTGGSLASTNTFDQVFVLCVATNNTWVVLSSVGNLTIT